jgi:hypothetical protein
MPRKLKTYQTSLGFFELAIAAPSMKAALQAWGSKSNLFHQGFAKEARDPAIIAVTMAKPGVVLRRAVGTDDTFNGMPRYRETSASTLSSGRRPRQGRQPANSMIKLPSPPPLRSREKKSGANGSARRN